MKKRQYIALICILVFFGIAAGMEFFLTKDWNLANYEQRIENYLHEQEIVVSAILADESYLGRQIKSKEAMDSDLRKLDLLQLKNLSTQSYNISLYQGDSLVFWTNNRAFVKKKDLPLSSEKEEQVGFIRLKNGYYEYIYKLYSNICDGCWGVGLIPVKNEYSLESHHLLNKFLTENFTIPQEVFISKKETVFAINSVNGEVLTWIDARKGIKDKTQLKLLLMIYLMGFIAMAVLVNDLAILLVNRYAPWAGAAFLIGVIFLLRYLTMEFGFSANFSDLHTFSDTFEKPVLNSSSSLGDLLINIVLLLWMMVFFHHQFQVKELNNVSLPVRFSLAALNYFSIILGILMISGVFKSLVMDSDITFDFDNVFNLNFYSFLSIVGIILLLFGLFLFSHRMMTSTWQVGLTRPQRLVSLLGALGASMIVIQFMDLDFSLWILLLISFLYIVAFDMFIEEPLPNLSWLVFWLVLFAAFSASLLFKYNVDKDYQLRVAYAEELANFRDTMAETGFEAFRLELLNESFIKSLSSDTILIAKDILENEVDLNFSNIKYLFHNYTYQIKTFDKTTGKSIFLGGKESLDSIQRNFNKGKQLAVTGLKFRLKENLEPIYSMKMEIAGTYPLYLFLEFERKKSNPSKVYTELLIGHQYKGLAELDIYDYAIYQDGKLIEEQGNYGYEKSIAEEELPPIGMVEKVVSTSKRWELLYHAPDNKVVSIGRSIGGYIKPISLFSYLFGLLVVTVIVLALINSVTNALPSVLNFSITKKPSLRNRIQLAVIVLILISFFSIGIISVWHFQNQSTKYHSGRLDRKAGAAKKSAQRELDLMFLENPGNVKLENLIEPTSEIHRLDVNLFGTDGKLISSSEKNIFQKGIVTDKMGAFAYFSNNEKSSDILVQDESVGDLKYKSAYVPLKNLEGKNIAYLGLPYYSQERDLKGDVTEFMGTLMNVYVFLLLIAGAVAIMVANSITRPISDIGDSMKRVKLGNNEPLKWDSEDELGELIKQYNKMIKKLEESTHLLAKSEREGAWREMAKQVAHEIKNPLTPMKLSIQYMLHAYQRSPDDIEPLLKRVSKTLVEQIDSLAQIANEFSNFAKMPVAESSKFVLNELTASVHALFVNESDEMDVSLNIPNSKFMVYADKNHLTRVLNNLIKNAIQAIPDDRRGDINVSLYRKEDTDDTVIIRVKDNGTGISDEMREKVFVPNFTTKSSGTGLGLAISKNIMESSKGKIYFETAVNVGTSFFIELPIVEVVG
ncbi:MAG: two-component system nitrogen regulation sensor histidine kinase NtrY [Paraglaciecola sp.]|jgi:two-component system nitrogen regulation sensor histidine kinase NtrY